MALTVKELMEAIIRSLHDVDLESEVIIVRQGQAETGRITEARSQPGPIGLIDGSLILVVE